MKNNRPLTLKELEMAECLKSQYDYICKKDAIRFFMSTYGSTRTIGQMVRAYNSINWATIERE